MKGYAGYEMRIWKRSETKLQSSKGLVGKCCSTRLVSDQSAREKQNLHKGPPT